MKEMPIVKEIRVDEEQVANGSGIGCPIQHSESSIFQVPSCDIVTTEVVVRIDNGESETNDQPGCGSPITEEEVTVHKCLTELEIDQSDQSLPGNNIRNCDSEGVAGITFEDEDANDVVPGSTGTGIAIPEVVPADPGFLSRFSEMFSAILEDNRPNFQEF